MKIKGLLLLSSLKSCWSAGCNVWKVGREEDTTKQKEIDETHLVFIDAIQVFWIIEPCLAWKEDSRRRRTWDGNKSTSSYNEP